MTKSTILDTIGKKIIFLFEWYYIVNKKLSLKTEKKEKTKVSQNAPLFFSREKKRPFN